MSDPIRHPDYYNEHPSGVECLDVIEHMPFNIGNAIKYLWRAGLKTPDPIQDFKKAIFYIEREISRLQKEPKR